MDPLSQRIHFFIQQQQKNANSPLAPPLDGQQIWEQRPQQTRQYAVTHMAGRSNKYSNGQSIVIQSNKKGSVIQNGFMSPQRPEIKSSLPINVTPAKTYIVPHVSSAVSNSADKYNIYVLKEKLKGLPVKEIINRQQQPNPTHNDQNVRDSGQYDANLASNAQRQIQFTTPDTKSPQIETFVSSGLSNYPSQLNSLAKTKAQRQASNIEYNPPSYHKTSLVHWRELYSKSQKKMDPQPKAENNEQSKAFKRERVRQLSASPTKKKNKSSNHSTQGKLTHFNTTNYPSYPNQQSSNAMHTGLNHFPTNINNFLTSPMSSYPIYPPLLFLPSSQTDAQQSIRRRKSHSKRMSVTSNRKTYQSNGAPGRQSPNLNNYTPQKHRRVVSWIGGPIANSEPSQLQTVGIKLTQQGNQKNYVSRHVRRQQTKQRSLIQHQNFGLISNSIHPKRSYHLLSQLYEDCREGATDLRKSAEAEHRQNDHTAKRPQTQGYSKSAINSQAWKKAII